MAVVKINLSCELSEAVKVQFLHGNLFSQDNQANVINVAVFEDGEPVELAGTVTANVIRPDGGTVAVTGGTYSGNVATITMPSAVYAIPGAISVAVKITLDSVVTTIAAFAATVYATSTDTAVDPGTIIPSIQTLIAEIEAAVDSIPADYSSLWATLAPNYSNLTFPVAVGQYCTYNGGFYRCNTAIATQKAWTAAHWTATNIGADLAETRLDVANFEDDVSELKSTMNKITGNKEIEYSDPALKQFIRTNGEYASWDEPSVASSGVFRWAVVECNEGDAFTVSGYTNGNNRLWAFADSDKKIITRSDATTNADELLIYAPKNANYLILNDTTSDSKSFVGVIVKKDLKYLNSAAHHPLSITGLKFHKNIINLMTGNAFIDILNNKVVARYRGRSDYWTFVDPLNGKILASVDEYNGTDNTIKWNSNLKMSLLCEFDNNTPVSMGIGIYIQKITNGVASSTIIEQMMISSTFYREYYLKETCDSFRILYAIKSGNAANVLNYIINIDLVDENQIATTQEEKYGNLFYSSTVLDDTYIADSGVVGYSSSMSNSKSSDFIPVETGDVIEMKYKATPLGTSKICLGYVRYNENKVKVSTRVEYVASSKEVTEYSTSYTVVSGVKYIRVYASFFEDGQVWIYKRNNFDYIPDYANICKVSNESKEEYFANSGMIKGIAHRGYSLTAPENTLVAFKMAKKHLFEYCESDVRFTMDSIPVLLHDDLINRTARNADGTTLSQSISVGSIDYEDLLDYDFGIWKGEEYAGTKIPKFEEWISLCKRIGIKPFIDIKEATESQIGVLCSILRKYDMIKNAMWNSGDMTTLGYIKNNDPAAKLNTSTSTGITETMVNNMASLKNGTNEVFILSASYADEEIDLCFNSGVGINVWAVDTLHERPTNLNDFLDIPSCVHGVLHETLNAPVIFTKYGLL